MEDLSLLESLPLLVSLLVGSLIGYTRRKKQAGLRTFILISLGSTLFTLISVSSNSPGSDPMRVVAQIVSGIGFLGLGVVWKDNNKLTGLTTAATIWVTAAIGILVGLHLWNYVLVSTLICFGVLESKNYILHKTHKGYGGA